MHNATTSSYTNDSSVVTRKSSVISQQDHRSLYAIRSSYSNSASVATQKSSGVSLQLARGAIISQKKSSCMRGPRADQGKIRFMPAQENVVWKILFANPLNIPNKIIVTISNDRVAAANKTPTCKLICRANNVTNSRTSLTGNSQCRETHRIHTHTKTWYHL